jgi:hypothetical protein
MFEIGQPFSDRRSFAPPDTVEAIAVRAGRKDASIYASERSSVSVQPRPGLILAEKTLGLIGFEPESFPDLPDDYCDILE